MRTLQMQNNASHTNWQVNSDLAFENGFVWDVNKISRPPSHFKWLVDMAWLPHYNIQLWVTLPSVNDEEIPFNRFNVMRASISPLNPCHFRHFSPQNKKDREKKSIKQLNLVYRVKSK